jgi:hypothetical protein
MCTHEQGAGARLLLLYTARPEFHAPWPLRAHHTQINLNRLGGRDVRAMVAQVAASKALADDTVATVVERTGGIPLFVEELTRAVLESVDLKTPFSTTFTIGGVSFHPAPTGVRVVYAEGYAASFIPAPDPQLSVIAPSACRWG